MPDQTGPNTPDGKIIASQNSLKHGLTARQLIVKGEDPAHLEALQLRWRQAHPTTNQSAADLVTRAANSEWLLLRAEHTFDQLNQTLFEIPMTAWTKEQHAEYQLFSRYLTTNQRTLDRDRRILIQNRRELRADTIYQEQQDALPKPATPHDPDAVTGHPIEQLVTIKEKDGLTQAFASPFTKAILLLAKRRFETTLVTRSLYFPSRKIPPEYAWCAPQVALFTSNYQEVHLYMTVKSLYVAIHREADGHIKFWPDLFAEDYPILKPLLGDKLCPPAE